MTFRSTLFEVAAEDVSEAPPDLFGTAEATYPPAVMAILALVSGCVIALAAWLQ